MALGLAPEDDDDANVADGNVASSGGKGERPAARRAADAPPPPVGAPTPDSSRYDEAKAGYARIKRAIGGAQTLHQLNQVGALATGNMETMKLIREINATSAKALEDLDTDKRMELAQPEEVA